MPPLVTTAWLADHRSEIRLLDATWVLPEYGRDPAAEFAAGHIPGARFLDLDRLADLASDLPHMRPSPGLASVTLGELGVSDADDIVLYDDSPHHSAARAWWLLRGFGARSVALLDGGLARWRAEGRPLETGAAAAAPVRFAASDDRSGLRTLDQVREGLGTKTQLVDARSAARFAGAEAEPRYGVAPGHIPGSLSLPHGRLFRADGTWKRGDELRAAFNEAGVDLGRPVIATCGSGITAAALAFGAHLLGRDWPVYDGSWAEWGGRADTPKATGAA